VTVYEVCTVEIDAKTAEDARDRVVETEEDDWPWQEQRVGGREVGDLRVSWMRKKKPVRNHPAIHPRVIADLMAFSALSEADIERILDGYRRSRSKIAKEFLGGIEERSRMWFEQDTIARKETSDGQANQEARDGDEQAPLAAVEGTGRQRAADTGKENDMLAVTLPADEKSGTCRINGREAEFRIYTGVVSFRYTDVSDAPWQRRRILDAASTRVPLADNPDGPDVDCILYMCE
jgi:hypothetical protein